MDDDQILKDFHDNLIEVGNSMAHAAILTLANVLESSSQSTNFGIRGDLDRATKVLELEARKMMAENGKSYLSVKAGCDIFRHHTHKTMVDKDDAFLQLKEDVVNQGRFLAQNRPESLNKIYKITKNCFQDDLTILVNGYSNVILEVLSQAAQEYRLKIIITECGPFYEGYRMAEELCKLDFACQLITDNAVAAVMEQVDIVMVGAEAVVENGGIINRIGTHGMAIIAKMFNRPFYVFAECLKFIRMFPLSQRDLPYAIEKIPTEREISAQIDINSPFCDLTPPELITLLFTDLGVLTPGAVSDELIQLYRL